MRTRLIFLMFTMALVLAACGGTDETATAPDTTSSTTAAPTTTTTSPAESTTTAVPSDPSVPESELPGEPIGVAPPRGTILSVLGVRHDDVLNVRRIPGLDGAVVDTLDPTDDQGVATGRSRALPNSVWWEITTAGGVTGWVSSSFTAVAGVTTDTTSAVLDDLGAVEGTIEEIGLAVAESQADADATQRIEIVVPPSVGDLGEVTLDVAGLGDDAVAGVRLHVFVVDEDNDGVWTLRTVEVTAMCQSHRGGTPGELCP